MAAIMQLQMTWVAAGLAVAFTASSQSIQPQPSALFAQLGLTEQQRAAIGDGRPVAKALESALASIKRTVERSPKVG